MHKINYLVLLLLDSYHTVLILFFVFSGMVAINHIRRVTLFVASASGLPTSEVTVAKLAKTVGYKTAIIGKHVYNSCIVSNSIVQQRRVKQELLHQE